MNFNKQQGIIPETEEDRIKARNADLLTLPSNITGTNCGNCQFYQKTDFNGVGICKHPKVKQPVSVRMCCSFWYQNGSIRV